MTDAAIIVAVVTLTILVLMYVYVIRHGGDQ
jgi:hypothetical protein